MIFEITYITAICLGLSFRFISHRINTSEIYYRPVKVLSIVVMVLGSYLLYYNSFKIEEYLNMNKWTKIRGRVISSEVAGEKSFYPEIIYQYSIEDDNHIDTSNLNIPGFGGKKKRYEVALKHISDYVPGMEVDIWVNPENNGHSVLIKRLKWNVYGQFGLAFIFLVGGVFMLFLKKKKIIPDNRE